MQGAASFIGTRGKTVADAYPERYLYYQGDAARIRVKTADYAGKPVSEKVTLKFIEQKWEKQSKWEENNGYKYETVEYIPHERELVTSEVNTDSEGNATYDYTVPSPGSIYVKTIVSEDGKQVVNRGGSFWAPDKKGEWRPRSAACDAGAGARWMEHDGLHPVARSRQLDPAEKSRLIPRLPARYFEATFLALRGSSAGLTYLKSTGPIPWRTIVVACFVKA
jgi:hypothetical protein